MTDELQVKLAHLVGAFTAYVVCTHPACRVEWTREQAPATISWCVRSTVGKRVTGMSQAVLLAELEDAPIEHVIACQIQDFESGWPL